jgi:hypothetical protein
VRECRAPAATRSFTISRLPSNAAECSAVPSEPMRDRAFGFAPRSISNCASRFVYSFLRIATDDVALVVINNGYVAMPTPIRLELDDGRQQDYDLFDLVIRGSINSRVEVQKQRQVNGDEHASSCLCCVVRGVCTSPWDTWFYNARCRNASPGRRLSGISATSPYQSTLKRCIGSTPLCRQCPP